MIAPAKMSECPHERSEVKDPRWLQHQAQRTCLALARRFHPPPNDRRPFGWSIFSDEWQFAIELATAVSRRSTGTEPVRTAIIAETLDEVKAAVVAVRRAFGTVRPDDPGWVELEELPKPARRQIFWAADINGGELRGLAGISASSICDPRFRPLVVVGLIRGAVRVMERTLAAEIADGFGWTRSQEIVWNYVAKQTRKGLPWSNHIAGFEAALLMRNGTHRSLIWADGSIEKVAELLISTQQAHRSLEGDRPLSYTACFRLFGGQRKPWIDWLVTQISTGSIIPSDTAMQWLARQ